MNTQYPWYNLMVMYSKLAIRSAISKATKELGFRVTVLRSFLNGVCLPPNGMRKVPVLLSHKQHTIGALYPFFV